MLVMLHTLLECIHYVPEVFVFFNQSLCFVFFLHDTFSLDALKIFFIQQDSNTYQENIAAYRNNTGAFKYHIHILDHSTKMYHR